MRVLETEVLAVASSVSIDVAERLRGEDTEARRGAARKIVTAFRTLSDAGEAAPSEAEIHEGGRYDSVLFGRSQGNKIVAFSFSGLASDLVVPLFSAAVALSTSSFGAGSAGDAANTLIGFWRNLSVLREPDDADAIAVIRAIATVRAREGSFTRDHHPSTNEIVHESSLHHDQVTAALRVLHGRRIVEIEQWGGQRGDDSEAENRWKFRL